MLIHFTITTESTPYSPFCSHKTLQGAYKYMHIITSTFPSFTVLPFHNGQITLYEMARELRSQVQTVATEHLSLHRHQRIPTSRNEYTSEAMQSITSTEFISAVSSGLSGSQRSNQYCSEWQSKWPQVPIRSSK